MSYSQDPPASISPSSIEENREGEAIYTRQQLVDDIAILVVRQFRRQRENSSLKSNKTCEEQTGS